MHRWLVFPAAVLILYSPSQLSNAGGLGDRSPAAGETGSSGERTVGCPEIDSDFGIRGDDSAPRDGEFRYPTDDTLWIFDADFEDLSGDNAGWFSFDMSGTLGHENYWHKDTIRINGFEWLGDSTWWCGTYDPCWVQPRGYGNDWLSVLERSFPEVAENTTPGEPLFLGFDQRYAMEHDYDYGYVDISEDGGATWTTVHVVNNNGFAGKPGVSTDWDHPTLGHVWLDLSSYAGEAVDLRFRFESDVAYSSEDEYDNGPPWHSVLDGAWQLDNITWSAGNPPLTFWIDDCESPGDNGWVADDIPATGQAGVTFRRVFEPETFHPGCWPQPGSWCMAATDSLTGRMVDGQLSWLIGPAIDIAGAARLVGRWAIWFDCPWGSNDYYGRTLSSSNTEECWEWPGGFDDPYSGYLHGGPWFEIETGDFDAFAGNDWFRVSWILVNLDPPEPGIEHGTGLFLCRQEVGVPIGGPATVWDYGWWERFHDTFDIDEALTDTARIEIRDADGVDSAFLVASNDAGQTWRSYPLIRESSEDDDWLAPPPTDLLGPATEIWYYFESTDETGVVRTHPRNAPGSYYEFSVLPIVGSIGDPGVLLVDKHGRTIPGEDRRSRHTSEYYYREALDVLGFEYDVYDVEVPSGSTYQSNGPDTSAMKYYDTQIWFASSFDAYTLKAPDQVNLIRWLSESADGAERNLLLTGNDIGFELIEGEKETLGFYSGWLASEYVANQAGTNEDTMLVLRDAAGGFDFMFHDDRECTLWGFT